MINLKNLDIRTLILILFTGPIGIYKLFFQTEHRTASIIYGLILIIIALILIISLINKLKTSK